MSRKSGNSVDYLWPNYLPSGVYSEVEIGPVRRKTEDHVDYRWSNELPSGNYPKVGIGPVRRKTEIMWITAG